MKKFVIISDSCCDLTKDLREKYDISYVPMHVVYDGEDHIADLDWAEISASDYYGIMRGGKRITTAQVSSEDYRTAFENAIKDGCDVLSISCSSALSASVTASYAVRDELMKKYPDAKIVCIDSLTSCMALGILCMTASELRAAGKTLDEVAAWVEEHKKDAHQEATPEKLNYLKQAGRVSAASAFFGGLLNIKPIIISDAQGRNLAVEKVKGRQTSIARLAERMQADIQPVDYQKIYVVHADCEEGAAALKKEIVARMPELEKDIQTSWIGPIIGASVGPGTIAVYFFGNKVTDGAQ
ncbi:MAG: DegV family protein [Clostridia bacterium]|nr:DegV family protein [Clostridia bacterium]